MEHSASHQTIDQTINTLETFSKDAADSLRQCMQNAQDVASYQKFLDTMYHYTFFSEDNLLLAAKCSKEKELNDYFIHMAKEERGHYVLAQKDLEAYNREVSESTPLIVQKINALWQEAGEKNSGIGFLGIVYVFENIAKYVGEDIKSYLNTLEVTKKQGRWLSVHAEADLDHGDEAREMVEKYGQSNPELLLETAQEAGKLWIELIKFAFETDEPAQEYKIAS